MSHICRCGNRRRVLQVPSLYSRAIAENERARTNSIVNVWPVIVGCGAVENIHFLRRL